ncbi:energy transducer TonB [Vibrio ouci]|uniref:Energy transducer TonB n=1 Tax=Vibrio ouci TaxID=2499078 RepID=A0A4Y8WL54_9VIBR|nr:energy transducer TonB [Vibrio ouci]TFH93345.1 energy transducer TonB [Vibrio ouci]
MNIKRYTIAGSLSLAIHAAFVLIAQEPKAFAMPAGAQSTSVSINFKTVATPPPPTTTAEPVTQAEPTSQPQKKVTPPKPKQTVKKPIPTKKKPVVKKKTVEAKPKTAKSAMTKTPVTKAERKPVEKVVKKQPTPIEAEPQAKPQQVNRGASAQPMMVERPSFLTRPSAPKYPRLARKRGVEGVALYEVWLDENGHQVKQVLVSSSGATMLDKSALDAIKKWKFSPHTVGGQKMAHRVQIPVRFKLDR